DTYADPVSGLAVGTAITLGLLARERTGTGQYMETTMLCSSGYALSQDLVLFEGSPEPRLPDREQRGQSALCRLYECASGWCMVSALQEKEWRALCAALGYPEWAADRRFATPDMRMRHDDELIGLLEAVFVTRPATEWEHVLTSSGLPVVSVSDAA